MNYFYLKALQSICKAIQKKNISLFYQAFYDAIDITDFAIISNYEAKIAGLISEKIEKYIERQNKLSFDGETILFRGKRYNLEKHLYDLLKLFSEKRVLSYSEIEQALGIQASSVSRYISMIRRKIKGIPIIPIYKYGYEYMG